MNFLETRLPGAFIVELQKHGDERGSYARSWCVREAKSMGLVGRMVQANASYTHEKGTLRGMHYQAAPHQEVKIVRCVKGTILDVIIDLRPESATFKQWIGVELTRRNGRMLYVPEGFAHGFQTLTNATEVNYLSSQYYTPESERGVRWNDPAFNIEWPITHNLILSDKDKIWPYW